MTLLSVLPAARTPDPLAAPTLRWGVIGTGWIADRFVASLQQHSSQQVVAVGSRTQQSAQSFADRHGIAVAYGSYKELVADDDVDVVYVATPHNAHLPVALLSLGAGKHTLVEKPLGATAQEARQIAGCGPGGRGVLHGGDVDRLTQVGLGKSTAAAGCRCPGRTTQRRGRLR